MLITKACFDLDLALADDHFVSYIYLYIAEVACWIVTGERQASRIRSLYLKTILRQDIGFFDTETTTGEVIGRMSGDTVLIQDAMGEKVNSPSLLMIIQQHFSFFIWVFSTF
jgi:ATP-binding cassette subfamily B (MDR/TAP) protein 1